MYALRENFLGADFRPVGLTAGSRALVRVVEDLEWLADRVSDEAGPALRDMQAPGVRVLRCSAAVLGQDPGRRSDGRPSESGGRAHSTAFRGAAGATARTSSRFSAQMTTTTAVALGRKLLNRRTIAATIGATGR